MSFAKKLRSNVCTLSFELLPPKNSDESAALDASLTELSTLAPDFVSVTYGAGGSTRQNTIEIARHIQDKLRIEAVPHLTSVNHTDAELEDILTQLELYDISNIMALRGDLPRVDQSHAPHVGSGKYASDLIALINRQFKFHIGCACYPEKHPQAASLQDDIKHLKLKQDCGAAFTTSQLFFDNAVFYNFREKAVQAGVSMPLIAGVLPVMSLGQLSENGFIRRCGADVPRKLMDYINRGDQKSVFAYGMDYAVEQCDDLVRNDIAGIHLYTMNRSHTSKRIVQGLRSLGHFLAAPQERPTASAGNSKICSKSE